MATYTYDLSDDKSCTYANRLMQYVIDDPADTLDETVWYYYDIEGNVERIVRKLDAEATYHSTKFVYNMGQSVRYVIGEEWDDDGLNWVRRETGGPAIEYLLTPSAMDWDDAVAYALSKGGVLASMYFEEDYDWVHGTFEPDSGYGEQRYWVGAYQDPNGNEPEPDGDWKWHLDGFPISPALYDPWQPGQPDDGGAGQCPPTNCMDHDVAELVYVEAGTDGLNDTDATLERQAIIQRLAGGCENAINFARTYAWEFRYDSPRARYLRRQLDPDTLLPFDPAVEEWSDYDGVSVTADFEIVDNQGPEAQTLRNYRTGIAHIDHDGQDWVDEQYYHGDQIDSTRAMTDENHAVSRKFTYTAFGERISTSGTAETRYQYAGGWGYQSHDDFPFLHVGARYYDPESGRFLQRDPIGIAGGVNVYLYVLANPIVAVDPSGLMSRRMAGFVIWVTGGDESWMDDDEKFKAVQDGLTAVGAAGLGLGLGALAPVYATYCAIGYGVGRTSGLSTGNDRADYSLDWIAIGVGIKTLPPWRGPQDPKVGWEVMKGVQF